MFAAALLLLATIACAGCGKAGQEKQTEPSTSSEEEAGTTSPTTLEESSTPLEEGTTSTDSESSVVGGNMNFSLDNQQIGSGTYFTKLKVTNVRWADHGDYFRIVFEYKHEDGSEATGIPNVHTFYPGPLEHKEYHKIEINLLDIIRYQFDFAPLNPDDAPVSLGDPLVKTIQRLSTADMEPVMFLVTCSYSPYPRGISNRPHRLMYQTHPMRVILDIQKT
jgi:hypothetical protein